LQVGKRFSQDVGRASLDQTSDIRWQRVGIATDEEMHVIGLDAQVQHLPVMLNGNFIDKLFKPLCNLSPHYPSPPLRTPDDVVHNQVYGMLFV
jgi:hypothetical protein